MHLLSTFSSERNLIGVTHLLNVACNTHLSQLLLLLLLRAVCNHQAFVYIKELVAAISTNLVVLILSFYRPTPRLDLAVSVGAHLSRGVGAAESCQIGRLIGSLLGHHGVEVVTSHSILLINILHWSGLLLLLKEDLSWHVLDFDEGCHSIIRITLGSLLLLLLLLCLLLNLAEAEHLRLDLLRLAMIKMVRYEVGHHLVWHCS